MFKQQRGYCEKNKDNYIQYKKILGFDCIKEKKYAASKNGYDGIMTLKFHSKEEWSLKEKRKMKNLDQAFDEIFFEFQNTDSNLEKRHHFFHLSIGEHIFYLFFILCAIILNLFLFLFQGKDSFLLMIFSFSFLFLCLSFYAMEIGKTFFRNRALSKPDSKEEFLSEKAKILIEILESSPLYEKGKTDISFLKEKIMVKEEGQKKKKKTIGSRTEMIQHVCGTDRTYFELPTMKDEDN